MGCCVSTQNATTTTPQRRRSSLVSPPDDHPLSKSPPTAEEEAVKEVLSETPHKPSKPSSTPNPNPNPYYYKPISKIHQSPTKNGFPTAVLAANHQLLHPSASPRKQPPSLLQPRDQITKCPPSPSTDLKLLSPTPPAANSLPTATTPDEISEVSEISCLSESVSTTTAADADGEVRQQVPRSPSPARINKASSFSADPTVRRDRLTGKSPVRRSDPSPCRTGPGREAGQVVVRNRGGLSGISDGQRRREPGENSARRSRSPATRNLGVANRSNVGRSPSGRTTGVSPGRVRMVQPGSGYSGPSGTKGEERGGSGGVENNWGTTPETSTPSESLENPLVSLECFIFL